MKTKFIVFLFITNFISLDSIAQDLSGIGTFNEVIAYEGQRYLMHEIYTIKTDGYDVLKLDKTLRDANQGFLFVLTSYKFNENKGAVFTSFDGTNIEQRVEPFRNVHLTDKEMLDLNDFLLKLGKNFSAYDSHILSKFNSSILVEIETSSQGKNYILWIEGNRHSFSESKWGFAMKRYLAF